MRTFTYLFLCLTLAFQGIAYAHAPKNHCPMEQAGHVMAMEAGNMACDCCNDAATTAKTGKPCKTGQECNLSHSYVLITLSQSTQKTAPSRFISVAGHVTLSFNPPSVWRPPTFV